MGTTPVWVWPAGQAEPVVAGHLARDEAKPPRFAYTPEYQAMSECVPLDPVEARLNRSGRGIVIQAADGLLGVLRDAKPAGYGADRLVAKAGRDLEPLELLEQGVPDGMGAIEVCTNIDAKLAWRPTGLDQLKALADELDASAPASRAMRRLNDDLDTSAGGERPKATLQHAGRLWLAKMQDRGDRLALPAREFVTMTLARQVGIDAAEVDLHTFGAHQVLLVARFDRAGNPEKPERMLCASAHTVLRLALDSVQGDPARSYLNFADSLRIWARGTEGLADQLKEVWRRMAFNALVGNTDDHPYNHALRMDPKLREWRLAPAFDITPALTKAPQPLQDGPVLKLATGSDNLARANWDRLIASAIHFKLTRDEAEDWLSQAAKSVAGSWEALLREHAAPIVQDASRMDWLIADTRPAFAYCEWLAMQH